MALITDLDDRTLVEHHHAGDEDAFRLIVERHHRSMYANAMRRLHDATLAEDAVQEAFLRAFRALPKFNGDYHLDAWLHRILTNVCHDIGRRQGRDTRLFDRVSGEHDVAAPPADDPLESMPREQLEAALESLPKNYREVLLLRFVDELSYRDVAIKAGITEENARARVSRGRTMLRRLLEGASAAVLWILPPLRRDHLAGEADVVAGQHLSNLASGATPIISQSAPAVSQTTPLLNQATNLVTQAMPGLVQVAPAASSSAPAMGKAAVAVGIAASVAIPAGVAVEKRMDRPEPAVAAPAQDAEAQQSPGDPVDVTAPPTSQDLSSAPAGKVDLAEDETTSTTNDVSALGGGAVDAEIDGPEKTKTSEEPTTDSSTTTEPTTTTTTPPPSAGPAQPPSEDDAGETPPPPAGDLTSDLTVVEAGPRLELDGAFSLAVDGQTVAGTLTGKLLVGDADPKDPEAPRQVEGDLLLQFEDGTTADLRIRGEVTVTDRGQRQIHDLDVLFRLDGGTDHELAESGDLTGTLETRDGSGQLHLILPGAPATE